MKTFKWDDLITVPFSSIRVETHPDNAFYVRHEYVHETDVPTWGDLIRRVCLTEITVTDSSRGIVLYRGNLFDFAVRYFKEHGLLNWEHVLGSLDDKQLQLLACDIAFEESRRRAVRSSKPF